MSQTKFISFKVGDPTLGITLYRSDNFNAHNNEFDGDKIEVQSSPAPTAFPLQSVVNGKKILDEKGLYHGVFEVLDWEDNTCERITTAYHPHFKSFDLDYQKSKGKSVSKDDLDSLIVQLNTGTISFKADSQMGKFLAGYTSYNGSLKGRNPAVKAVFENFDHSAETEKIFDAEETKFEAMKFVMDAKASEQRVFNLGAVFGLHNHNNDTATVVATLIQKVKSDTKGFLKAINAHKSSVEKSLKSAQGYEIIRFVEGKNYIEMLDEGDVYSKSYETEKGLSLAKVIKQIAGNPFEEKNAEFIESARVRLNKYTKETVLS